MPPASAPTTPAKKIAIYVRVSTDKQTIENQERELRAVADRAGWQVVEVYKDEGISGAKGRDGRPAFDAMLKDVTRRKFDVVMAWSVDRLGRSLQHLVGMLSDLQGAGVDLFLHQQAIDTTTPAGKALFQMMGVFAEFERSMIRDRVNAGLARAKANGKRLGKAPTSPATIAAVRAELAKGTGVLKTGRMHKVGTATVQQIKKEMMS
jgi:DNA invertase Pin-like site-specific DNA recombinase